MGEAIDAGEELRVSEWIDGLNDVEARISAQVTHRRRARRYLIHKILLSGLILYGSSKAGLLSVAATSLLGFAVILFSFEWTQLRRLKKEREAILARRDPLPPDRRSDETRDTDFSSRAPW